jgi:hypothetical protein
MKHLDGIHRPQKTKRIDGLYDSKLLCEIPFDDLFNRMHDRLYFHANRNRQRINGLDFDDIFQELSIELWTKLSKLPDDMDKFDYRYLRYMDRCFFTCLGQLYRRRCTFTDREYKLKDGLDRKVEMDINLL